MAYIVVDYDGTVVTHEYPIMGKDIGVIPVLKELVQNGHQLILFTMRSGKELTDAVYWFKENNIPLFGIQTNPTQHQWTDSPKAYGHLIIDDAAAFAPLKYDPSYSTRPFIDWTKMREELVRTGWIIENQYTN
jgi:hypothetical protein